MAFRRKRDRWFPDESFYTDQRCSCCGVCCGATDGDPCASLRADGDKYYCDIYENRLGYRKTVSDQTFRCVTIKHIIETTGGYAECIYVRELLRRRAAVGKVLSGADRGAIGL